MMVKAQLNFLGFFLWPFLSRFFIIDGAKKDAVQFNPDLSASILVLSRCSVEVHSPRLRELDCFLETCCTHEMYRVRLLVWNILNFKDPTGLRKVFVA